MKIVHLQHPYIPNMGYQENYLPFKQHELGHDVHMVTTDIAPTKFLEDDIRSKRFNTGTVVRNGVPIHRHRSFTYDTEAATVPLDAVKRIRQLHPDVIHSHRLISLLSLLSPLGGILDESKLFFDLHIDNDNFHLDKEYKKWSFKFFQSLVSPLLSQISDGYIPVNPHSEKFLKNKLKIPESKIYQLPLGVDTNLFYPSQKETTLTREQLDIPNSAFTAITAGNLNESKNIIEIISAINNISDMYLLIVGKGPDQYMSKLKNKVQDLNLTDRVLFHDFVEHDELSKYYNAADVGIWPGKLGITILEAIGCGLPVIVDDSDATQFLIANNNGLRISNPSSNQIEDQLKRYKANDQLRVNHKENAIELVENDLSWEEIAKRSIAIYEK